MKNNIHYIKNKKFLNNMVNNVYRFLLLFGLCTFFLINNVNANNIQFKAKEILTLENGNIIIGRNDAVVKINSEIEIFANKYTYNKKKNLIVIENKVEVFDLINKIKLDSELIHYKIIDEEFTSFGKTTAAVDKKYLIHANKYIYNKKKNLAVIQNEVEVFDLINKIKLDSELIHYKIIDEEFISFGKTTADVDSKYLIESADVHYNSPKNLIFSDITVNLTDNLNNKIKSSKFKYLINKEIFKGYNIELHDNEKNKYFLSDGIIKLNENLLIGKDIKVLLRNDSFGVPENEPKLKGSSVSYKNNLTKIKKGIFTSCKSNKDKCPPWSITSKEIIHNKEKKEIHYKNAWLKIYDIPIMYFPKFFHPDPTVSRKSGFLIPTFGDSSNLGASVIMPYFYAMDSSSDLTFKPRIFSDDKFLLHTEYRKVTKNSSHIVDMSLNKDKDGNQNGQKTHFFSNSKIDLDSSYFDESDIFVKLEKVSNDDYIKIYSLEGSSPIMKNTSVLESSVEYTASKENFFFDISVETYETQNKANSDRFEFIYPNYSLSNVYNIDNYFINNLSFNSSGNQKKFNTNVHEGVQINDLIATSNDFINKFGVRNSLELLLKNVNSVGKNSSKFKDDEQAEILTVAKYDLALPLIKNRIKYNSFLTPKISARYSPNSSKNNKEEDRNLNIDNVFSSNRIGFNDSVEGGGSLTLGLNYEKKNLENELFLSSNIATVIRKKNNNNLPSSSTLGKKQSDFIGDINFFPNENINFKYDYSIDDDLNQFNLHRFTNIIQINNFVNEFIFYEENNLIGNESFYENTISYNYDKKNNFSFKTKENKKTNLTEYYDLIYEYKTDCLVASMRYNKEYYTSSSIKPREELFFNITLIPLGSTKTDNLMGFKN